MDKKKLFFILILLIIVSTLVLGITFFYTQNQGYPLSVYISEDGYLCAETFLDDSSRKTHYFFWETDGGSLTNLSDDNSTPAYFTVSQEGDQVLWTPLDSDNNNYTSATIKVYVVEEIPLSIIDMSQYSILAQTSVTLTYDEPSSTPVISNSLRVFGNPIRENSSNDSSVNWQEIYKLYEYSDNDNNYVVLRYRTGNPVSTSDSICWETNAAPLSKASFSFSPLYTPGNATNKRILKNTDTVCFNIKDFDGFYFTNESTTNGIAEIKISAFVVSSGNDLYKAYYQFNFHY